MSEISPQKARSWSDLLPLAFAVVVAAAAIGALYAYANVHGLNPGSKHSPSTGGIRMWLELTACLVPAYMLGILRLSSLMSAWEALVVATFIFLLPVGMPMAAHLGFKNTYLLALAYVAAATASYLTARRLVRRGVSVARPR